MKSASKHNRSPNIAALLSGIFLLFSATAALAQDSEQPETSVVAQQSALTLRERGRIEAFLIDRFRAERISRDLVAIIMKRIDAAAIGGRVSDAQREHPATTSHPSIALQIVWQTKLEEIAKEFHTAFDVPPPRRAPHPIMLDVPPRLPDLGDLHNFTVTAIREAQGEIGEELLERPLPPDFRFGGKPSAPREIGRYAQTIRIAPGGIALVDEAVPQALNEVRAKHPEAPLDDASFPVPAETANLLMPAERFDWTATEHALACVRWFHCSGLGDLVRAYAAEDPAEAHGKSFAFLDSAYLTNPYGEGGGTNAIVQLDQKGAIVGAFCSRRDAGYQPGRMGGPPVNREHLRACLEAAMGY